MNETLQFQIDELTKRLAKVEQTQIQLDIDPNTNAYLLNLVGKQIYSTAAPSGTAPIGSVWLRDTGALATNTIHVWSGTSWVQIK